jgi:membrane protein required for beta-lactamase induction
MNPKQEAKFVIKITAVIVVVFIIIMGILRVSGKISNEKFYGFTLMGLLSGLVCGGGMAFVVSKNTQAELNFTNKTDSNTTLSSEELSIRGTVSENKIIIRNIGKLIFLVLVAYLVFCNYYFVDPSGPIVLGGFVLMIVFVVLVVTYYKK